MLQKGLQGNRPITLVGFSLGARVIFKCLQTLAETEQNAELVERVVILGAPISINNENWRDVRKLEDSSMYMQQMIGPSVLPSAQVYYPKG